MARAASRPRVAGIALDPEDVEGLDGAGHLQEPLGLEVEVQVHEDVHVGSGALAEGGQLVADGVQHVAVRVQLGEARPPPREAGRVQVGVGAEHEHVGLERGVAAADDLLAGADAILEAAERRDLHLLRPLQPVRPAVRPVEADALADRAAEQLVDGHTEGPGLEIEQGVLDGTQRLLDDAARGLPAHRVEPGADRLVRPGIVADHLGGEPVDDRGDAEAAERLVVLAPADQPVVGRELEEVEVALTGIGVQMLDPGDLHVGLSAGRAGGVARPRRSRIHA